MRRNAETADRNVRAGRLFAHVSFTSLPYVLAFHSRNARRVIALFTLSFILHVLQKMQFTLNLQKTNQGLCIKKKKASKYPNVIYIK